MDCGCLAGNISHAVSYLESKELVHRSINQEDARSYGLKISKAGEKTALKLISFFNEIEKKMETKIGKTELKKIVLNLKLLEESYISS